MSTTTGESVVSLLTYLKQQSERFELFHAGNFQLAINDFCDYFVKDQVVAQVYDVMRRWLDMSPKEWHEQANREGKLVPLPQDPVACFAFRFAVLRFVRRKKIDLRHFVTNHFPGAHLNEMMMHWKRLIVHPFASDCRTLADGVMAQLGNAEWVDVPELVEAYFSGPFQQESFGPRAWTDADDEAAEEAYQEKKKAGRIVPTPVKSTPPPPPTPEAAAETTTLDAALQQLQQAIEGAGLPAGPDLLLDLQALRLEVRRSRLRRDRVLSRLETLGAHEPLRAACDRVRQSLPA